MKNYFVSILFSLVTIATSLLLFNKVSYARNELGNLRQQIEDFLGDDIILPIQVTEDMTVPCDDPESLFIASVKRMVSRNTVPEVSYDNNGSELFVIREGEPLSDKEYKTLFGSNDKNRLFKTAMANSICNLYGISREELLRLRQQKIVINKAKREINKQINELFNESLEIINSWLSEYSYD